MEILSKQYLVGEGRSAEIYAWRDNKVIKLFHIGCPESLIESEVLKCRLISEMGLPTPKFIEIIELAGRTGLVFERVHGISMLKMINQHPWQLFRLARQFAELHGKIHRQEGAGFPSIQPALEALIQAAAALPGEPASRLTELLRGLPDGHALCHLDFHPDQVMMTERGPIILDWATAYQGHPLADVCRTTLLLTVSQVPYGGKVGKVMVNLWRRLFLRTYLSHYFKHHPEENRKALTLWLIPIAISRLSEGITGEKRALLEMIEHAMIELGISQSRSILQQFTTIS